MGYPTVSNKKSSTNFGKIQKRNKKNSCINLSNNPSKGHTRGEAVITNVKDNNIQVSNFKFVLDASFLIKS